MAPAGRMLPVRALALAAALLGGATAESQLVTAPTSPYGYKCGEAAPKTEEDEKRDQQGDFFHYIIAMPSPTTFGIQFKDSALQRLREFHPLKCMFADDVDNTPGGRLLLLQNACYLKNTNDVNACFRKEYFSYPVRPDADTVKHELRHTNDKKGLEVWGGSLIQKYGREDEDLPFPGEPAFELCSFTGSCVPGRGMCQPSFWIVAENWATDPYTDAWSNVTSLQFKPFLEYSNLAYDWNQVHHTKQYGPYPHCPHDSKGRAMSCKNNETLTIRVAAIEVKEAQIQDTGKQAVFDVRFTLEWDDRYAVHPCTINLWKISTAGRQLKVEGERHWAPNLTATNEKDPEKVRFAEAKFGVNLDYGKPVKNRVTENRSESDYVHWPKQLVLNREYQAKFYPEPKLNWDKFPYDTQTLVLKLGDMKIASDLYKFELAQSAVNKAAIDVGDDWKETGREVKIATEKDGRQVIMISVSMKRQAMSKMYTLMLPAISFAGLDIVGHLLMPYDESGQLFMAQALMIGVSIAMCDPGFLGIPPNLGKMPFMQCFNLMLVVGTLKTAILLLGRFAWLLRLRRLRKTLFPEDEGAAAEGPSVDPREISGAPTGPSATGIVGLGGGGGDAAKNRSAHKLLKQRLKGINRAFTKSTSNGSKTGGAAEARPSGDADKMKRFLQLERHLDTYDHVVKASVPLWYLVSLLSVSAAYGVL